MEEFLGEYSEKNSRGFFLEESLHKYLVNYSETTLENPTKEFLEKSGHCNVQETLDI